MEPVPRPLAIESFSQLYTTMLLARQYYTQAYLTKVYYPRWYMSLSSGAVNNHWTGLLEWTTGMDYWTDLFLC